MRVWSPFAQRVSGRVGEMLGIERQANTSILIRSTIAALIFGVIAMGLPLENVLRMARNAIRQHASNGEIVVVAIDDRTLEKLDAWPLPRHHYGQLIRSLQEQGANRIFFDLTFPSHSNAREDLSLARALADSGGKVTLATQHTIDLVTKRRLPLFPLTMFSRHAELANVNIRYDFSGWVWSLPYAMNTGGRSFPSFAAKLARVNGAAGDTFPIDYSVDPRTVDVISLIDVLSRRGTADRIQGKDVLVGTTSAALGDTHYLPGHGRMPGVFLHALGAETLKAGRPFALGWLPALMLGLIFAVVSVRMISLRNALVASALGTTLLLVLPLAFEANSILLEVTPAIFLLAVVVGSLSWSSYRRSYKMRGTINATSGLLNLDALRQNVSDQDRILIVARVHNYPQIASALPAQEEQALVAQIASRLTLGGAADTLYQGDEGIFAWFAAASDVDAVGEHLDALYGFFRNSVTLGEAQVDLTVSFGLDDDVGGDRSIANRLGSALVACDEAAAENLRWKAYDASALDDAPWKLSLLGQLDRAIDNGDFWVAYQPKLDLVSGRICGAEALARWTHPQKGAIAPLDFILAAEQSDRIEKLTHFVLDEAIKAAAGINASGLLFGIAVNMSTRLVGEPGFVPLVRSLLAQHGLEPGLLTLEITETAAFGANEIKLDSLLALRDLGVVLSIDDYGTGLSTLEYLKKIPATEIKIDQTFVGAVTRSQSDRLMVHSTIQLVHSLGRRVVAEGVEDQATLDALIGMGCDYAQGFFIGRPTSLVACVEELTAVEPFRSTRIVNRL